MARMSYRAVFHHEPWIDNVDRVQAGGDNGFNIRFHDIENEFHQIRQVLALLSEQVSTSVTIGLTPVLLPWGDKDQWTAVKWSVSPSPEHRLGTFVEPEANEARGVLSVELPNGAQLISVKVLGEMEDKGGGLEPDVTTKLYEESRTAPYDRKLLVEVSGLVDTSGDATPIPGSVTFDGAAHIYYFLVKATNASNSVVRLRGFQLTYQL